MYDTLASTAEVRALLITHRVIYTHTHTHTHTRTHPKAPQKLRNRTNANQANLLQSSPRTRVNRYIGRLIEARQTESDTADLNFLTLMYKCSEREQRVRDLCTCAASS